MTEEHQAQLDVRNAQFWDELCGTVEAKRLGVVDHGRESLQKFDRWYMGYYPYLSRHVPFERMHGRRVLEIGLGFGTVAQRIAEASADYVGLDIAANPVAMVNHRLRQNGLAGRAIRANMLNCPFEDRSFDWIVAIGCFHHTGNLQRCLDESWRVLLPGGRAVVMVYNAYSYRRWQDFRRETSRYFLWDKFGIGRPHTGANKRERGSYDDNLQGEVAPETVFTSAAHMRRMTRRWSKLRVCRENIAVYEWLFKNQSREAACLWFGPLCGLDLYCELQK